MSSGRTGPVARRPQTAHAECRSRPATPSASRAGRFAPSPSGPLHLGNLRTALVAWLSARAHGARFLVRIEDLDRERTSAVHARGQLADLRALGLDWDAEPVRQSERRALYADALAKLRERARLYPCFCSRAEIRKAASAPHDGLVERAYPGTCRAIAPAVAARRIAVGEPYALRIDAGEAQIEWSDQLLGTQRGAVDDFVVVRKDGVHAYQLAVVVDDADQQIGEVVRGADLASSTPRQILLQRLLGLPSVTYAHVGLVLGAHGRRLAKRDHGTTLADRAEPAAVTLALLAHSIGLASGRDRVGSAAELIPEFDLARIPHGPVSFS